MHSHHFSLHQTINLIGAFHPAHSHCEHDHDHSSSSHHKESNKGTHSLLQASSVQTHLLNSSLLLSILMFQTLSQRMEAMTTDTTTLKTPRKVTNALQSMIMDMAMDTPTLFYPSRPRSSRALRRPATQRYLQTMKTMDTPMPMPPTVALMGMHTATMIRAPIRRRRVG